MGFQPSQDETVFHVKFVIVYVILEASGKTSSFPQNHALLLPSALVGGWRATTPGGTKQIPVGVAGFSQQLKSSSFQFMSTFSIPLQGPLR